jgi:Sec-independent protein translocase protein TatA
MLGRSSKDSRLYLDLFGLGPTEIVIVIAAAGLLYGPDKVKGQLRDSGVENPIVVSKGLKGERRERIKEMTSGAQKLRKKRAWDRVNEAIADDDEEMLNRIQAYEGISGES